MVVNGFGIVEIYDQRSGIAPLTLEEVRILFHHLIGESGPSSEQEALISGLRRAVGTPSRDRRISDVLIQMLYEDGFLDMSSIHKARRTIAGDGTFDLVSKWEDVSLLVQQYEAGETEKRSYVAEITKTRSSNLIEYRLAAALDMDPLLRASGVSVMIENSQEQVTIDLDPICRRIPSLENQEERLAELVRQSLGTTSYSENPIFFEEGEDKFVIIPNICKQAYFREGRLLSRITGQYDIPPTQGSQVTFTNPYCKGGVKRGEIALRLSIVPEEYMQATRVGSFNLWGLREPITDENAKRNLAKARTYLFECLR